MRKAVAGILVLASCSSFREGTDRYHDGMSEVLRNPGRAQKHFSRADRLLAEAMAEEDLDAAEAVTATANRVRSLVELDRHEEASALLATRIPGYSPQARYEGDLVGLALVKSFHVDPERGYAQLILAEPWARTERSILHLAWQQARLLRIMGTPKSKAEAARICDQYAGKLDFDAMKKDLTAP